MTQRRSRSDAIQLEGAVRFSLAGGLADHEPWMARRICDQTDPEVFFPEKGGSTAAAKRICGSCPVRQECLVYALRRDERFGIWGGLSERERRKLKKAGLPTYPPKAATRVCALDECDVVLPVTAHGLQRFCAPSHAARDRQRKQARRYAS